MSQKNHHEESSFWPAYVDAITNVMLNILFVVAVFAMALNTVVKDAPKTATEKKTVLATGHGTPGSDTQATAAQPEPQRGSLSDTSQPKPLFVKESTPRPQQASSLRWAIAREEKNSEALMRFDFEPGSTQIEKADASGVREALRKFSGAAQASAQASSWNIWVSVNTRNTAEARQAYLRAMSVRSALIEAGHSPKNIEVRLLDAGDDAQTPGQPSVWMARSIQSPEPS